MLAKVLNASSDPTKAVLVAPFLRQHGALICKLLLFVHHVVFSALPGENLAFDSEVNWSTETVDVAK